MSILAIPAIGPANPAGSDTQVQYNSSGSFGASAGLVFDGSNLGVNKATPTAQLDVVASSTSTVGTRIIGAAGQTANVFETEAEPGKNKFIIDKYGWVKQNGGASGTGSSGNGQVRIYAQEHHGQVQIERGQTTRNCNLSFWRAGTQYWQIAGNSGTADDFEISASGGVGTCLYIKNSDGLVGVNEAAPAAQCHVTAPSATTVGLIVKGAAAQTGNLLSMRDSADTVLTKFTSAGRMEMGPVTGQAMVNIHTAAANELGIKIRLSGGLATNRAIEINDTNPTITSYVTYDGTVHANAKVSSLGVIELQESTLVPDERFGELEWTSGHNGQATYARIVGVADRSSVGGSSADGALAFDTTTSGTAGLTERMRIDRDGLVSINNTLASAQLHVTARSATTVGQRIDLAAAQTANAFEVLDSNPATVYAVSAAGHITSPRVKSDANSLHLGGMTALEAGRTVMIQAKAADDIPLTLRWFDGTQTANFLRMEGDGKVRASISSGGQISLSSSVPQTGLTLHANGSNSAGTINFATHNSTRVSMTADNSIGIIVQPASATIRAMTIKGAAAQTSDLTTWTNSSGTALARFDSAGKLGIAAIPEEVLHVTGRGLFHEGGSSDYQTPVKIRHSGVGEGGGDRVSVACAFSSGEIVAEFGGVLGGTGSGASGGAQITTRKSGTLYQRLDITEDGDLEIRNGTGSDLCLKIDRSATAGDTRMLLYDVDTATLQRVTVGAADSGGAGFKVLKIPN